MKREIKYIVIHTTATHQTATVENIQRYWKEKLGWNSPGYHRIIEPDGTINKLESFDKPTNGVKGHNRNSIHISYIGGIDKEGKSIDNRTPQQKAAIIDCICEAIGYAGRRPFIQGHRDFEGVKKDCPCFDALEEYARI
ncbi:MAG TPA: N-acetylmuramoyl-L-alanine amidase [Ignavibacteriaceae bacterium]